MAKEVGVPEINENMAITINPWCFTPFLSGFYEAPAQFQPGWLELVRAVSNRS
jgi:hypothetical protein